MRRKRLIRCQVTGAIGSVSKIVTGVHEIRETEIALGDPDRRTEVVHLPGRLLIIRKLDLILNRSVEIDQEVDRNRAPEGLHRDRENVPDLNNVTIVHDHVQVLARNPDVFPTMVKIKKISNSRRKKHTKKLSRRNSPRHLSHYYRVCNVASVRGSVKCKVTVR